MTKPQSPELMRSGNIAAFDPDNIAARVQAAEPPGDSGPTGPVPEDNRPGHHPASEDSKPDLHDFVERFNRAGHVEEARSEPVAVDSGILGVVACPGELGTRVQRILTLPVRSALGVGKAVIRSFTGRIDEAASARAAEVAPSAISRRDGTSGG